MVLPARLRRLRRWVFLLARDIKWWLCKEKASLYLRAGPRGQRGVCYAEAILVTLTKDDKPVESTKGAAVLLTHDPAYSKLWRSKCVQALRRMHTMQREMWISPAEGETFVPWPDAVISLEGTGSPPGRFVAYIQWHGKV